jgi:hypothetical protein
MIEMDTLQIASLSTSLSAYNLQNQVSTIVLRKALDNQETATGIINQIPQVPANPSIGRHVNTTA